MTRTRLVKHLAKCSYYTVPLGLVKYLAKWLGMTRTRLVKYLAKCSYYTMGAAPVKDRQKTFPLLHFPAHPL